MGKEGRGQCHYVKIFWRKIFAEILRGAPLALIRFSNPKKLTNLGKIALLIHGES